MREVIGDFTGEKLGTFFFQEITSDGVIVMEHLNKRKSSDQVTANVSFYFHNL